MVVNRHYSWFKTRGFLETTLLQGFAQCRYYSPRKLPLKGNKLEESQIEPSLEEPIIMLKDRSSGIEKTIKTNEKKHTSKMDYNTMNRDNGYTYNNKTTGNKPSHLYREKINEGNPSRKNFNRDYNDNDVNDKINEDKSPRYNGSSYKYSFESKSNNNLYSNKAHQPKYYRNQDDEQDSGHNFERNIPRKYERGTFLDKRKEKIDQSYKGSYQAGKWEKYQENDHRSNDHRYKKKNYDRYTESRYREDDYKYNGNKYTNLSRASPPYSRQDGYSPSNNTLKGHREGDNMANGYRKSVSFPLQGDRYMPKTENKWNNDIDRKGTSKKSSHVQQMTSKLRHQGKFGQTWGRKGDEDEPFQRSEQYNKSYETSSPTSRKDEYDKFKVENPDPFNKKGIEKSFEKDINKGKTEKMKHINSNSSKDKMKPQAENLKNTKEDNELKEVKSAESHSYLDKYVSADTSDLAMMEETQEKPLEKKKKEKQSSSKDKGSKRHGSKPFIRPEHIIVENDKDKSQSLSSAKLAVELENNLKSEFNIESLTVLQQTLLATVKEGNHCIIKSRTGTGKSLFTLAGILNTCIERKFMETLSSTSVLEDTISNEGTTTKATNSEPDIVKPKVLVVVPSSNLLEQYRFWVEKLLMNTNYSPSSMIHYYDGLKESECITNSKVPIVIGLPRETHSAIKSHSLSLEDLKICYMDEVDTLLQSLGPHANKDMIAARQAHLPYMIKIITNILKAKEEAKDSVQFIGTSATVNRHNRKDLRALGVFNGPQENISGNEMKLICISQALPIPNPKVARDSLKMDNVLIDTENKIDDDEKSPVQVAYYSKLSHNIDHYYKVLDADMNGLELSLVDKATIIYQLWKENQTIGTSGVALCFVPYTVSKQDLIKAIQTCCVNEENKAENIMFLSDWKPTNDRHSDQNILYVGSDVDARGLDFPQPGAPDKGVVKMIIILGKPATTQHYVHMAGRLGRLSSHLLQRDSQGSNNMESKINAPEASTETYESSEQNVNHSSKQEMVDTCQHINTITLDENASILKAMLTQENPAHTVKLIDDNDHHLVKSEEANSGHIDFETAPGLPAQVEIQNDGIQSHELPALLHEVTDHSTNILEPKDEPRPASIQPMVITLIQQRYVETLQRNLKKEFEILWKPLPLSMDPTLLR